MTQPAILIVDDLASNQRLYRAILRDCGAELVVASSGEQAIAQCAQRDFAMILLDVQLSAGMNGFETAQRLRQTDSGAHVPIVFVSAVYILEDDAFRAYRLGAVDYIMSPVVPDILRAKVSSFIRLHRLLAESRAHNIAMEAAYRELRLAHTELEHFSWTVSHDLRTPLAQLAGFAELLRMHAAPQMDQRARDYLAHVIAAGKRMGRLIDDLLALARITRGELKIGPVDLSALARQVAADLAAAEPQRQVQWQLDEGLQVQADERLLRVALGNLLGNAWKYSAGSDPARIEFGRIDGDEPTFRVRDNGAGFDLIGAGERLFRPFQRFHADQAFKGTGIGLAIVQSAVVKHGGRVWAESRPGAGASFFFTLPGPAAGVAT